MRRRPSVGQATLEGWLQKWQTLLGLRDWKIGVELVDFLRERQSGDLRVDLPNREALVMLARRPWRADEELTLVHELMHLVLWRLDQLLEEVIGLAFPQEGQREFASSRHLESLEEICQQLARALLHADRGQEPPADYEALAEASRDRVCREGDPGPDRTEGD